MKFLTLLTILTLLSSSAVAASYPLSIGSGGGSSLSYYRTGGSSANYISNGNGGQRGFSYQNYGGSSGRYYSSTPSRGQRQIYNGSNRLKVHRSNRPTGNYTGRYY